MAIAGVSCERDGVEEARPLLQVVLTKSETKTVETRVATTPKHRLQKTKVELSLPSAIAINLCLGCINAYRYY